MIDTDKYEGHTQGPWHIENEENNGMRLFICSKGATILWQCETTHADALLVADAPLLLAEVKRLLSTLNEVRDILLNDDKGCEDSPSHYALLTINEVIE